MCVECAGNHCKLCTLTKKVARPNQPDPSQPLSNRITTILLVRERVEKEYGAFVSNRSGTTIWSPFLATVYLTRKIQRRDSQRNSARIEQRLAPGSSLHQCRISKQELSAVASGPTWESPRPSSAVAWCLKNPMQDVNSAARQKNVSLKRTLTSLTNSAAGKLTSRNPGENRAILQKQIHVSRTSSLLQMVFCPRK